MKSNLNRRQFITTLGAGVVATRALPIYGNSEVTNSTSVREGGEPGFWVDPRFAKQGKIPWRKVHLDFHNSKYIPKIGAKFNADEWGDRLLAGNVDSIVVFAKDMHGYFYYQSKYGPVHPGLSFDLLGEQVKACRQRKISVYAYYCTTWDHYLADSQPGWNMLKRDGSDYRPKPGETPGWTALCLGNKRFTDMIADHVSEFISKYELDGAWLDMAEPIAAECYCSECLIQIKAEGKDPYNKDVQRDHQNKNFLGFHRRMKELVHSIKPQCQVDFNDIGIGKVSERSEFLDNIDIEALPTGGWGYFYAPAQIRYQRNFGLPVYGMTGRFVSSWADFGGLKLPQQLDVELAGIVANAARCDVGDQMPPDGQLDAAVYHVLGKSFGRIKKLEPWLNQAAPVTEAVMLIPSDTLDKVNQPYIFGLVKLMMESHLQFDLMETGQEWERYNLVFIPDELLPDSKTVERLHKYISKGGAVVVCHNGGLQSDTNKSWLERYGMTFDGQSVYKPAYFVAGNDFISDMPGYAYALYDGASQWKVQSPAISLAQLGEPLFQRSAEHFTSHRQSPFDHVTDYSVLAKSGTVGLIAFPLGGSYNNKGYWIYRSAFEKLLNEVLPSRLVETNAPLSTEITITYQPDNLATGRKERYMVHVINWSSTRKTPQHPEVHEDPVALTAIRIKLNIPLPDVTVKTVLSDTILKHKKTGNGIEVTIPRILIHEIVCFEPRRVNKPL
jgi:hypothetical protein